VPEDFQCYLTQLLHASQRWQCSVHAYVLMPDHVYLLVTPVLSLYRTQLCSGWTSGRTFGVSVVELSM
jgi:REP element-mobilizing transposase RayT